MRFIQRFGAVLLIIAAAFFVYAPALRNGFVWDDTALVLRDPLIRSWRLIPEGFQHFLFLDATGSNFYRPLQRLTFTMDYALWGLGWPGGWHLTSIAIHAAAGAALYALLRRWWGPEKSAWALGVALLWVIHPLHTSAVTYVAGRADPLAALAGFGGLLLLWSSLAGGPRRQACRLGAAACFLAALLSKESGVIFLVLALALLGWRRVARAEWVRWGVLVVVILASYGALRSTAARTPPPPPRQELRAGPWPVEIAARAVAEYAGLVVAPVTLRMERDVAGREPSGKLLGGWAQTLAGAILVGLLIGWFRWGRRTMPDIAVALVAAGIAYFPISNVVPLNATAAEHWLYVPSAFLFAAGGLTLARLDRRSLTALAIVWALALALRTLWRQADWHDQRTFLSRTIAAGGDSARMRVNLGNLEASEGHLDRAMAEYQEALQRQPALAFAHLGVAGVQLKLRNFAASRAALEKSRSQPGLEAEQMQLRGALDFAEKQIDPLPSFRSAAELAPLNWPLRRRYLTALVQTGRLPVALEELRTFLRRQDFRADSWLLLADFADQAGRPEIAQAARREARLRDVRLP